MSRATDVGDRAVTIGIGGPLGDTIGFEDGIEESFHSEIDPVSAGVDLNADRWDEIAAQLEADATSPTGTRICSVARSLLQSDPIGLLMMRGGGSTPVEGTDGSGEELDEAQTILGEGPTVDAMTSISPVVAEDLASTASLMRWPGFVARAAEAGVASAFAFPMRVGGVRVGVMTAYRTSAGPLTSTEFADALVLSSLATLLLMESGQAIDLESARLVGEELESHSRLQIAAGMVSERLDVSVADALVLVRAHAYANDARLDDVARAIIDRTLELDHWEEP